jgi:hypothetical protein
MVVFEVNPCALGHAQQCQQLTRLLPQLKSIGVEVIYLMPFFKKGVLHAVGSPYCIADFESMESTWGSVEDWNVFRETCETLGLRIWMDWVMNHTAWDHPWVKEHPEFYHQDENGKLHHPLGTDWTDVVQLNGGHAEVLLFFMRLAEKCVNRGVTGFRVDAAYRMPSTYLSQWINHIKELSLDTMVLVDAHGVMMQQPLCDGLMTSDSALWNKEKVWPVLYGHDAAAFGLLWCERFPEGNVDWRKLSNGGRVVWSSAMWHPNERISFFESRNWGQAAWERWLGEMGGQE